MKSETNLIIMANRIARALALICALALAAEPSVSAQDIKAAKSAAVATLGGAVITEEELKKAAARDLQQLELQRVQFEANYERSRHAILEKNLSRLLEEKLLEAEAAKRGISKEQLLSQEVQGKIKEPTQDDVMAYYEANKQNIGQPVANVNAQIQQYLKTQNSNKARSEFLEQLRKTYGVTVSLEPLRVNADAAGSPFKGPEGAPVKIVVFSDFQCPYCAQLTATLRRVMEKYGKQVRLVFRNFPLSQIHSNAENAAEASICAADQGRFWEMHDLLFATQQQLSIENIKSRASQLQLNMDEFNSCLASGRHADRVNQDLLAGARLGVTGTPALFINGRFLSGAQPFEEISRIIEEELKSASGILKSASSRDGSAQRQPSSKRGSQ